MKAMVVDTLQGPDALHASTMPVPVPSEHELLVRVRYASINPVDWMIESGALKNRMPHRFPLIPGWDAAGEVTEIGRRVRRFQPGDRVFAFVFKSEIQEGTYAEFATVHEDAAARIPANVGFREAASVPLAGLTAWQALFDVAGLKGGDAVLILGAAGGVGSFAVSFAKTKGAFVVATARKEHHGYVKGRGADAAIDYLAENVVSAVRESLPAGVDVVLDLVGGDATNAGFSILKRGGRLVSTVQTPDPDRAKALSAKAETLFVRPNGEQLAKIAHLIEVGAVSPPQIREFRLEDAVEAQKISRSRHLHGKLVLRVC